MKTLFAVLLAAMMLCPVVFAAGCSQGEPSHPTAVAPNYNHNMDSNRNVDQNPKDNGSEWYGGDADNVWK